MPFNGHLLRSEEVFGFRNWGRKVYGYTIGIERVGAKERSH